MWRRAALALLAGLSLATGQASGGPNAVMAQGGMLVNADTGLPWNPTDFELTTEEGFKYLVREGVGTLSVTDPYGNQVSYGSSGYQHNASLAVTLTRDSQGRITRATDPKGQSLTYSYNAAGELESVTDRAGGVTRFAYASVSGIEIPKPSATSRALLAMSTCAT